MPLTLDMASILLIDGMFLLRNTRIKISSHTMMYRTCIVIMSLFTTVVQLVVYPWCVATLKLPIPHLALGGSLMMIVCYLGMVLPSTSLGSMIFAILFWVAFCFATPLSISVISVGAMIFH